VHKRLDRYPQTVWSMVRSLFQEHVPRPAAEVLNVAKSGRSPNSCRILDAPNREETRKRGNILSDRDPQTHPSPSLALKDTLHLVLIDIHDVLNATDLGGLWSQGGDVIA
jgi:hypothetical protein